MQKQLQNVTIRCNVIFMRIGKLESTILEFLYATAYEQRRHSLRYISYRKLVQSMASNDIPVVLDLGFGLARMKTDVKPHKVIVPRSLSAHASRVVRQLEKKGLVRLRRGGKGQVHEIRLTSDGLAVWTLRSKMSESNMTRWQVQLANLSRYYSTRKMMAESLCTTEATLSRWRNGKVIPSNILKLNEKVNGLIEEAETRSADERKAKYGSRRRS